MANYFNATHNMNDVLRLVKNLSSVHWGQNTQGLPDYKNDWSKLTDFQKSKVYTFFCKLKEETRNDILEESITILLITVSDSVF
jgi:hypothetical protein